MAMRVDYGEHVIATAKPHWKTYVYSFLFLIVGVVIAFMGLKWVGLVFILPFFYKYVSNKCKKYIVTTRRVIYKEGILHKDETVIPSLNINNVIYRANFLQRILGAADVTVVTGNDNNLDLIDIANGREFANAISRLVGY